MELPCNTRREQIHRRSTPYLASISFIIQHCIFTKDTWIRHWKIQQLRWTRLHLHRPWKASRMRRVERWQIINQLGRTGEARFGRHARIMMTMVTITAIIPQIRLLARDGMKSTVENWDLVVKPDLSLEELDVVDSPVQHGHRVHLVRTWDQAPQRLEPVSDPVPPLPRRHALRVRRQLLHPRPGPPSWSRW